MGLNELNWMIEHPEELEKYHGKWIGLSAEDGGIIAADEDLDKVAEEFKKRLPKKTLCIFRVPKEDEQLIVLWSKLNTKK